MKGDTKAVVKNRQSFHSTHVGGGFKASGFDSKVALMEGLRFVHLSGSCEDGRARNTWERNASLFRNLARLALRRGVMLFSETDGRLRRSAFGESTRDGFGDQDRALKRRGRRCNRSFSSKRDDLGVALLNRLGHGSDGLLFICYAKLVLLIRSSSSRAKDSRSVVLIRPDCETRWAGVLLWSLRSKETDRILLEGNPPETGSLRARLI